MDLTTVFGSILWLDTISRSRHGRSNLHRPKVSRKEARKQDREEKKRRKAEYFSSLATNAKRVAHSPHPESPAPKRTKVTEPPWSQVSETKPRKFLPKPPSGLVEKKNKFSVPSGIASTRLVTRSGSPTLPRSQKDEDENRYIAFLEAKLNSGNTSKKGAGFIKEIDNDGLGGG
jgi:nucleolar MIF4G domain-containing protein 1